MLDRTLMPPVQPLEPAVLLSPESYVFSEVPVFTFVAGDQPLVKIEWVFQVGKVMEDVPGAAFLTGNLIKSGTASQTAQEIAEKLAQYGASLAVVPHLDYTSFSLTTLAKFAEELIPWVTRLFWEANFPEEEVERQVEKKRQNLQIDLEKTSHLASVALREGLFGADHPYGQSLTLEEIDGLTREAFLQHHQKYHRQNLTVFLSGQVAPEHVTALEGALSEGPAGEAGVRAHLRETPCRGLYTIAKEGMQTTVRVGKLSLPKGHPDFYAFRITNHALGGYFGSRLMQNLREDKGMTYGVYSQIAPLHLCNYFSIGADVKQLDAYRALDEIKKEIELLQSEPLSEDELARVKAQLFGKVLGQLNSPFSHAEVFKGHYFWGREANYFHDFFPVLEQITPEEIQRVAQEHLVWDTMEQVLAGVAKG